MSSEFQIKLYKENESSQYIQEYSCQVSMPFSNENIQKAREAYESFKSSVCAKSCTNYETSLTAINSLNLFHTTGIQVANSQISDQKVCLMALSEKMDKQLNSKNEVIQTVDIQPDRSSIVSLTSTTHLQQSSKTGFNSPLWAISQNTRLKQEISTAIMESKGNSSSRTTIQEVDPLHSTMKQLFNQLVLTGKLTIENGKVSCSYNGQKFVFDIPPEWNMNAPASAVETAESSNASQESTDRDASWNQIIIEAIDQSPGAVLDKLPETERAEVLRNEWLVNDPLTGICTGLALEFLLDAELKGDGQSMLPSDEARYWEKLLIPMMEKVMQLYYCDHPDQLNQERHYRAIYEHMIKIVEKKAHLKASIQSLHIPLYQLGEKLQSTVGHSLVCIELPGTPAPANHTIYFNSTTRKIADNGVIIKVPEDDNYGAFVDFYMESMEYHAKADRFTLISVKKDPQFNTVRKPSMADRISLSAEITFNFLLKQMVIPNASLKDYDVAFLNPYTSY